MPELYRTLAIRPAQDITPKIAKTLGHQLHPKSMRSRYYHYWCKVKQRSKLLDSFREHLNSKEVINTIEQIPEYLRKPIQFAENHRFNFEIKELISELDFESLDNDGFAAQAEESKEQRNHTNYVVIRQSLADSVLARTGLNQWGDLDFDLRKAILTLDLVADLHRTRGDREYTMVVNEYYRKPFIYEACLFATDPCDGANSSAVSNAVVDKGRATQVGALSIQKTSQLDVKDVNDDGELVHGKEERQHGCECDDFLAKIYECECDKEASDDCDCECDDECVEQNPCCATIEPFVAELFIVKDEVTSYEAAEISYIENIIKGEERVRKHRHLQREEVYTEAEEESISVEERDQQTETQLDLHNEVNKLVERELSLDAGVSYEASTPTTQLRTHLNIDSRTVRKDAQKIVRDESKRMIDKALSRVEKKVRSLSTRKLINETEETVEHTFDNVGTDNKDISRQLYSVTQLRKAQVYSHGKRMFLEFYLPGPAELWKSFHEKEFKLKKPRKPCLKLTDIRPQDYTLYVDCLNFYDLEKPPKAKEPYYRDYTISDQKKDGWRGGWVPNTTNIHIDEGYKAVKIQLLSSINYPASNRNRLVKFTYGGVTVYDTSSSRDSHDDKGPKTVNVTADSTINVWTNLKRFDARIRIWFEPKEATDYTPWKIDVLNRVMNQYNEALEDYNEKLAQFEQIKERKYNQNDFSLSETIKEQLQHQAINYISCQFFEENDAMKNKVQPCGYPQMDIQEAHKEGKFVEFFQQAFQWKFMSYMLYPYFYERQCTWADKSQEESNNGLFTRFLRSGSARVSVAVTPGFEGHVSSYLTTRHISPHFTPDISADVLPIYQEIKEDKDNFNADRAGHLIWDDTSAGIAGLQKNQIILRNNNDYYEKDAFGNLILDPITSKPIFDPDLAADDINREIVIDCIVYRIISITLSGDELVITLDRDLELKCKGDELFEEVYNSRFQFPWSTGAIFIGAPWVFKVPTSLVWLREEAGCLPCYPIPCNSNNE